MEKIKTIVLFLIGFCGYITCEVCFRGYSYPLMGICGGIAVIIIDKINDKISWDMDIILQCICGSALITGMEFIIGSLFLMGYLPVMWDYSSILFNYKGIICFPFSMVWMVLSLIVILVADCINYYVFGRMPAPYYKIFGRTFLILNKNE